MDCNCSGYELLNYGHRCLAYGKTMMTTKGAVIMLTPQTLETLKGRIRFLTKFNSSIFHSEYHAIQQACNFMIQGSRR